MPLFARKIGVFALFRLLPWAVVLALWAPSLASAQVGGNAPAGVSTSGGSKFAGSMVAVRPMVSALTLNKAAEPTWNPYVGTQLMLAPRYTINRRFSVSALLIANREWTNSDWTNEQGETTLSDTFVTGNARLLSSPRLGLGLAANAQLRLPTSKASLGRTLVAGALAGMTGSWAGKFKLFGAPQAVSVALIGRVGRFFHRYAQGSLERPWLSECGALPAGCGSFSHSGARNIAWRIQAIGALSWRPHPRLTLALQAGSFFDHLEPLVPTKAQGYTVTPDASDPSERGIAFYLLSASTQLTKGIALALGTETANGHLRPDSSYRAPIFNRTTTFFLSLRLFPAALLQ